MTTLQIKRIPRGYFDHFYANKCDNLYELGKNDEARAEMQMPFRELPTTLPPSNLMLFLKGCTFQWHYWIITPSH